MIHTRDCFQRQRGLIVIIILLAVGMILEPSIRGAHDACLLLIEAIEGKP